MEREAAFTQQLAQLQALVANQDETAAASEVSPSEAGDAASADQLEEDEVWTKVERGKRKGLLRRERDALASKVRASLGKVKTCTASLFKK